ncbi:MAG: hypothetical protein PHY72_03860 [Candidatus Pacebacteria bacterium]|nr:hypothetical protein [Candidatus Paceibacterota bacterium]
MNISENKEQIKSIIIGVLAIGIVALAYYTFLGSPTNLSAKNATDIALAYINSDLLTNGSTATLEGDISNQSGLYKFKLNVGGQSFDSFVTKDGKFLFPQVIEIKQSTSTASSTSLTANNNQPTPKTCDEIAKVANPQMEAFVVSYCPYGIQMQRVLTEVVKSIPELAANIKIMYIGSVSNGKIQSMHGDQEAVENLKQICIREEQPSKFYAYLSCFIQEGKSDECSDTAGIDKIKLQACATDSNKGLKYAQADFTASEKYGVSGSPTLVLDGQTVSEYDFGGRTAQAVKTLLCCGFSQAAGICSTNISTDQVAVSFSKNYSDATGGSTNAASCN